jgi:hypothetical protein
MNFVTFGEPIAALASSVVNRAGNTRAAPLAAPY